MTIRGLSQFRVGGLDDEGGEPTEPVTVTCGSCGERSPWFTYRDDGGADRTAPLGDLVAWALAHDCDGLRSCSRCGDRVGYLSSRDLCDGCEEEKISSEEDEDAMQAHERLIDSWDERGVSGYEL